MPERKPKWPKKVPEPVPESSGPPASGDRDDGAAAAAAAPIDASPIAEQTVPANDDGLTPSRIVDTLDVMMGEVRASDGASTSAAIDGGSAASAAEQSKTKVVTGWLKGELGQMHEDNSSAEPDGSGGSLAAEQSEPVNNQ